MRNHIFQICITIGFIASIYTGNGGWTFLACLVGGIAHTIAGGQWE